MDNLINKIVASPAIQPVIQLWNEQSSRDKLALKALAIFGLLFLIYSVAVKPILDYETTQKGIYESRIAFMDEVKGLEPQLKAATKGGSKGIKSSGSLTSKINRQARSLKLNIKQISPDRNNQVQVSFENADSVALLKLIQELSGKHQIKVSQASIDRRSQGRVNAKLVFAP